MRRVIRIVQDQRDARYNLLRGFFHGADDNSIDELEDERLATVNLPKHAQAVGKTLADMSLQDLKVRVLSLRRSDQRLDIAIADVVLVENDTLVLSGKADGLALAEQRLLAEQTSQRAQSDAFK